MILLTNQLDWILAILLSLRRKVGLSLLNKSVDFLSPGRGLRWWASYGTRSVVTRGEDEDRQLDRAHFVLR